MSSYATNMFDVLQVEERGIKYIRDFKNLLILVQKLRGITNYLSLLDEVKDKKEFKDSKKLVIVTISQVREKVRQIKKIIDEDNDSFDIKKSFGRFSNELNQFNTDIMTLRHNYLEKYTKFTKDIINFFVKISENSYLLADMQHKNVILIDLIIEVLPTLLEYVGKLRGLGIQIIDKKVKNLYDSTQLQLHIGTIKNTLKDFDTQIEAFLEYEKDITVKDKIRTVKSNISKEVNHFVDVTIKELQHQDIIFYDKKHFFELAEDILIADNALYKFLFKALDENIEKNKRYFRSKAVQRQIAISTIGVAVTFGLSFLVYLIL